MSFDRAGLRRLWLRVDGPVAAAALLLAVAASLPPLTLERPGYRFLVAVDITQSMDVEDMTLDAAPASRLAFARAAMRDALARLPCGSELGWAVFADYRTLPLMRPVEVCRHHEELLASLERIDGRMRWADASSVGKGLGWALRAARHLGDETRIVFITDGHEAPPVRAGQAFPSGDLKPGEVAGLLAGVGGDLPARIPKTDREGRRLGFWAADEVVQPPGVAPHAGREHLSALHEAHLRALTKVHGLAYRRLTAPSSLGDAMLTPGFATPRPVPTDLRWVPALLAGGVLLWRFRPTGAVLEFR